MPVDILDQLDLNLLRVLDVLLEERSVTRAAARLGRSQPATSHALQRLRDALDDPLLIWQGREMVPTPRAEALGPELRRLLDGLRRSLTESAAFDPATARRRFVLGAPDSLAPLVPDLLGALADAPGVTLELVVATNVASVREVDLLLGSLPEDAPGVQASPLGTIHQRVAMRAGHPALDAPWTPEGWIAWPHITVRTHSGEPSFVERALDAAGYRREVGLVVPTFLLAAHVAARSEMLYAGPGELLQALAEHLPLVLRPPPVPFPPVPVAAMWSERLAADAGHRWLRRRVVATVRERLRSPEPR